MGHGLDAHKISVIETNFQTFSSLALQKFTIRERSLSIEQRGAEDFVWGHEKKLAQCVGL